MRRRSGDSSRRRRGPDAVLWLAGIEIAILVLGLSAVLRGASPQPDYATVRPVPRAVPAAER